MSKEKALVTVPENFVVDIPDEAPKLPALPTDPTFSWRTVLPSNYLNMDIIEETVKQLGGNPIYTVREVRIQPVVAPEDKTPDLTPKIVLYFNEIGSGLVMNVTRCTLATEMTGTPNPIHWANKLPALELSVGINRKFATSQQILIGKAPDGDYSVDQANEELFG